VNASLAFIENAKPKDEVESALLIQMACTHTAAMSVLATFAGGYSYGRHVPLKASAAARLMRAYATQVETLRFQARQFHCARHFVHFVHFVQSGSYRASRPKTLAYAVVATDERQPAEPLGILR
jgi:hypothetical protein